MDEGAVACTLPQTARRQISLPIVPVLRTLLHPTISIITYLKKKVPESISKLLLIIIFASFETTSHRTHESTKLLAVRIRQAHR